METQKIYAVDYETAYDNDYSLKKIPNWPYVWDPVRFNAYMVSVVGEDGSSWVGHPKDFDWGLLEGAVVLHHNASFDALVTKRLQFDGVVPHWKPAAIYDTADLAAFLKFPRALKDIAKFVFNLPDVRVRGLNARERMKRLPVEQLMSDPEIIEYCTEDSRLCLRIWREYSDQWPEEERELSRLNREAGWRGLPVDMAYVENCVERLKTRLFDAARGIPWDWPADKTPLARKKMISEAQKTIDEERPLTDEELAAVDYASPADGEYWPPDPAFVSERLNELWGSEEGRERPAILYAGDNGVVCAKIYMWYPTSFAQADEECEAWEDEYGDRFPWIGAVRDWRRQNMLLQKFEHLRQYSDSDCVFHYQKKYFGAHPGRFSGDGRFNVENLPREEMFCERGADGKDVPGTGFHLRKCFKGDFFILDYKQVEARVLLALVKDERQLEKVRAGMSVYEAHARDTMGWEGGDLKEAGKSDPACDRLYRLAKARVLGGGYGCGGAKFAATARTMAGLDMTADEGKEEIGKFRASNLRIVQFWRVMDGVLQASVFRGDDDMQVKLTSGRIMHYWAPRERAVKRVVKTPEGDKLVVKTGYYTQIARGNKSSYRKTYGANLVENCIASGTQVLTDRGWVDIATIGPKDKVHDGYCFVSHGGLVFKSIQPCVEVDGVHMTCEHEVFTDEGWKAALEKPRPVRPDLRSIDCASFDWKRRKKDELGVSLSLRSNDYPEGSRGHAGGSERRDPELRMHVSGATSKSQNDSRNEQAPGLCCLEVDEGSVPSALASFMETIWRAGHNCLLALEKIVRRFLVGHGGHLCSRIGFGQDKQQPGILEGKLPLDYSEDKLSKHARHTDPGVGAGQSEIEFNPEIDRTVSALPRLGPDGNMHGSPLSEKPVYDILDCGARHQFVVLGQGGPFIVHNCCQGIARDLLRDGWLALDRAGLTVLTTVHDEFIVRRKEGVSLDDVERIILEANAAGWSKFIPLALDKSVASDFSEK